MVRAQARGAVLSAAAVAAAGILAAAAAAPPPQDERQGPLETVVMAPTKLLSLLDEDFSLGPWTFHGYFEFDGAEYDQRPSGPLELDFRRGELGGNGADVRDLSSGAYLRRARLGGEGRLGEHIAYRAMFDLSEREERGESRIAEVWASYGRFAPYLIQVGAFPQPANMEEATPADSRLFMERATAADMARGLGAGDGRIGVTLKRTSRHWVGTISLTGPVLHQAEDYSPRAALVGRISRAFYPSTDASLHIGVSGSYVLVPARRKGDEGQGFPVRFIGAPELRVDDAPLIDTGDIPAEHASVVGLEFAARRRNLYLQGEAFRFHVDRSADSAGDDPRFFGFYVQGSWVLTGEGRRFDPSRATFRSPKPRRALGRGGWGAWELAARYSYMDLDHRAGAAGLPPPLGGVRGGRQQIFGVALEWFPRERIRVTANLLRVSVDRLNPASPRDPQPFGPPPATPPVGTKIGQNLNIFGIRLRYGF